MKKYRPHAFQKKFHASNAKIRVVDTGRQTGKTLGGEIETVFTMERGLSTCCNAINRIVDGKYICRVCGKETTMKPIKGMIVAPTYGDLDGVNIQMMKELVPSWFENGWNEQKKRLTHPNGSVVIFKSAEEPDRLRGGTLDFLWLDEAAFMKPRVWDVVQPATLVRDARIIITTTPNGKNWVYRDFYSKASSVWTVENPMAEVRQSPIHITRDSGDPNIEAFHYRTFDVEHIPLERIIADKARMIPRMFRQEYLATHEEFTGMVYEMYSEKLHTIDKLPDVRLQYFVGIDVGHNNPTAILLAAEDENHNIYIIDEVYKRGLYADDIFEEYNRLTAGKEIRATFIDPASKQKTSAAKGVSLYDQLVEMGMDLIPADNDVIAGIDRVSQLLKPDIITGIPGLRIHKRCVNLREEIEGYIWDTAPDEKNAPERPRKFNDHAVDALRYLVNGRPDWYKHDSDRVGQIPLQTGAVSLLEERIDPDLF